MTTQPIQGQGSQLPIDPQTNQPLDKGVVTLAKSIRSVESNNRYDATGASGEYGAYQFMAPTWKSWAGQYLGDSNAQMTPVNQDKVAYYKIQDLKNQGFNPEQVASIWNSGSPDPTGKVGTNSKGVSYDTPKYVNSVIDKYKQFGQGIQGGPTLPNPSQATGIGQDPTQQEPQTLGGFVGNIFSSGANLIGGLADTIAHPIQSLENIGNAITHPSTIMDSLKQRYGSLQNIENTLYKDPAGVALDVSTLLGGVGALGKLGAEGSDLARIGQIAGKTSEATNPLALMGKGVGKVASGVKNVAQEAAGITTGEGAQALKIAEQSAKVGGDAQAAFRGAFSGADNPETILQDAQSGFQGMQKARASDYQDKLSQIKEADHTLNMDTVALLRTDFEKQLQQLNITRNADSTLNFSESILDSDARAKRIVQQLDGKITSAEISPNPNNLDNIKRFAADAWKPQDPLNTITQVVKNTSRTILNDNVPQYAAMTKGYSEASDTLQEIKDATGIGGKAKQETVMNKIMSSLNRGKENRMTALEQLGGNKYLAERIAGYKLHTLMPGGLAAKFAQGEGLGIAMNPALAVPLAGGLVTSSPKIMGLVSQATGLTERAASKLVQALVKTTGLKPAQIAQLLSEANRTTSQSGK